MPLRLSMLFAPPVTFPYTGRVWNDSLGQYVHVSGERIFHGLRNLAFTTGLGAAYEYKRFYSRLAITFPVVGPQVEEDSATVGFELRPYAGFELGLRVF